MPGSSITPVYGPNPTGPAENLTGYFVWELVNNYVFQCTALNFQGFVDHVHAGSKLRR